MRTITFFFLCTAVLSGLSCLPSIMPEQKGHKFGGKYILHDNPQVGDYAVYKLYGRAIHRGAAHADIYWESYRTYCIIDIKNGEIEIAELEHIKKQKAENVSWHASVVLIPEQRVIYTDMEGNIKRAYFTNTFNGALYKVPIAQPGEEGFIRWNTIPTQVKIYSTSGKEYISQPVWFKKRTTMTGGVSFYDINSDFSIYTVKYLNDRLKFKMAMMQYTFIGGGGASVDYSAIAGNIVTSLSFTNFFSQPASLIRGAPRGSYVSYLKKNVVPSKQEGLDSFLQNMGNGLRVAFESEMQVSMVMQYEREGRMTTIRLPRGWERFCK